MPDQRTTDRSTVDTSDPDVSEPGRHEARASERDASERDVPERDARDPDAAASQTARERAEMVGVTEPTQVPASTRSGSPNSDAPPEPVAPAESSASTESSASATPDTQAPRDAENSRDDPDRRDAGDLRERPTADAQDIPSSTTEDPSAEPDRAAPAELGPGDVPVDQPTALLAGEDAEAIRERWRELQSRFVDDPHAATAAADDLVGEVVDHLSSALSAQRKQLGDWRAGGEFDTERLRVAVTGYRDFLDRILSI